MLKKVKQELFWFLKRDAVFNLDDPSDRQIYVQQVLSRGHEADIRELIADVGIEGIREVFDPMKRFIPAEVRMFWEDFFADHNAISKKPY